MIVWSFREYAVRGAGGSLCGFDRPCAGQRLGSAAAILPQCRLHHQVKPQHGRYIPPGADFTPFMVINKFSVAVPGACDLDWQVDEEVVLWPVESSGV